MAEGRDENEDGNRGGYRMFGSVVIGRIVQYVMLIPVIAIQIAAIALMVYGAIETWHFVAGMFDPAHPISHDVVILHAIEIVDLFLLATVVQVVSLGLYQLYFNQDLALPGWLKIRTLDDLKYKLLGVTITVLSVYFLGRALVWTEGADITYLGIAVALVIVALTFFLGKNGDKDH